MPKKKGHKSLTTGRMKTRRGRTLGFTNGGRVRKEMEKII